MLDNLTTGKRENLAGIAGDVQLVVVRAPAQTCPSRMRDCEIVFHQAAIVSVPYSVEHPDETLDVNVRGTLNSSSKPRGRQG